MSPAGSLRSRLDRLLVRAGLKSLAPGESDAKLAADARDYWTASAADPLARDLSHWAGEGRWNEDAWRAVGRRHLAMYRRARALRPDAPAPDRMVEWGPGGGANAVAFAEEFPRFVGVDISEPNLTECARRFAAEGRSGFEPVLLADAGAPEAAIGAIGGPVQFFLCTAVIQHMPSKEYGLRVVRIAREVLEPGALALLQIRYDDGSERFAPKRRDYRRNAVFFTSYRIEEFWRELETIGFDPLWVELDASINYAWFAAARKDRP